ncbi:S8 family serine peptidase [Salibacter sp.]|uniref:S8 family serine peptidase n=1 Tax=Salibacter sp. TaxID=2010995 RepID=UPI00287015C3|nr:S8 family serine peptidase [Salibacter sp.]MDR9486491.1 S8 family serine peptidase [Salibacter sp.]
MKSFKLVLFLLAFAGLAIGQSQQAGKAILKIEPQYLASCGSDHIEIDALQQYFQDQDISIVQKFPNAKAPTARSFDGAGVEIRTIYELTFDQNLEVQKVVNRLKRFEQVEYAEPKFIDEVVFQPNDTRYADQQPDLELINAPQAWDILQGNPNAVVAIVDNGTDIDHPDLVNQLYQNPGEQIDGSDSDNNGYEDDLNGWDFVNENGNTEVADGDNHGIHVAGIAAASTNNNSGVASTGFYVTYMPVKVGEGSTIRFGYDGIVYAADNGAQVINCSWGSSNYSDYANDIIDYATINQNALVVAAAGNNEVDEPFYPAAYKNALAVSSVNSVGDPSFFSNYGYWIDIAAPGENILSTVEDGGYNNNTGTSMAAPAVSGAVGLLLAQYPSLTPNQIRAHLKATASSFSQLDSSSSRFGKFGAGILDMEQMLSSNLTTPYFSMDNVVVTDSADNILEVGDTVYVYASLTNFLAQSSDVWLHLNADSNFIVVDDSASFGSFSISENKNNLDQPFRIVVNSPNELDINSVLQFDLYEVNSTSVLQTFYKEVILNPGFINVDDNRISTTATSIGRVGYYDNNNTLGLGLELQGGQSMLFEAGLMVGSDQNGSPVVVDDVRNDQSRDRDFSSLNSITRITNPAFAFLGQGSFTDTIPNLLRNDSLGVVVNQRVMAYDEFGQDQYVLFEYRIRNVTNQLQTGVRIGFFTDFDVENYNQNKVLTDEGRRLLFTKGTGENDPLAAVQLIEGEGFNPYAVDNVNGGGGGIDISDSLPSTTKWQLLSESRESAGNTRDVGNDVIQVLSSGPYDLAPNDEVKVCFALFAAETERDLYRVADSAYYQYNGVFLNGREKISQKDDIRLYPNPVKSTVRLVCESCKYGGMMNVKSITGETVLTKKVVGSTQEIDLGDLSTGTYLLEIHNGQNRYVKKILKL